MRKSLMLVPAAMAAALAAVPLMAQETPAAPPAVHPQDGAEIRLDFGAGRKVAIDCGTATLDACIASAQPLIDKVASTPAVERPGMGWFGKEGHRGKRGDRAGNGGGNGGNGGGNGGGPGMGAMPDAPPPAETPAP